jgi:hypothetical protein
LKLKKVIWGEKVWWRKSKRFFLKPI